MARQLYQLTRRAEQGEEAVLRTARQGPNAGNQFCGCPNFPRCRAVRQLG